MKKLCFLMKTFARSILLLADFNISKPKRFQDFGLRLPHARFISRLGMVMAE